VDGLVGFRYLELREGLGVAQSTTVLATAQPILDRTFGNPGTILSFDQFDTYNRFYGGQVGLRSEWWRDRLFVNTVAKVALGVNHQSFDVFGATSLTPAGAGAGTVLPGGLLAQLSNSGHFSRDRFSVVPELGVNVGYQVTDAISVFVGYTFLYWTNVARPGDQISPVVNSTTTPGSFLPPSGPTAPIFQARDSDFWAQGVNFGVGIRF
jgi:Putative beta barrel porin-7 (BBP7)